MPAQLAVDEIHHHGLLRELIGFLVSGVIEIGIVSFVQPRDNGVVNALDGGAVTLLGAVKLLQPLLGVALEQRYREVVLVLLGVDLAEDAGAFALAELGPMRGEQFLTLGEIMA